MKTRPVKEVKLFMSMAAQHLRSSDAYKGDTRNFCFHFTDLKVGQYMTAMLEEVKNEGRVVRLSVNPTAVNQACAEARHGWTLSNLLPGLLVQTCIKKVTSRVLNSKVKKTKQSGDIVK